MDEKEELINKIKENNEKLSELGFIIQNLNECVEELDFNNEKEEN